MSNSSYAFNPIVAAQIFSIYGTCVTVGLGFIGNIINILVFTNLKIFHLNRCAFYLIAESIVDIAQLVQTFTNEIWKVPTDRVEPTTISMTWCKLRTVFAQWFRLMLASIVCFAAVDQFLCTHHVSHLRRLSSLNIAKWQIYFTTMLCLLHTIPFAVFLQIRPSLGCVITNPILTRYYSLFFYPVLNGLLPIFVSSLFSILAYQNVRRIIRRQIPIDRRRLDQQLTAMIFVRVICFVLLQLPFTFYRIFTLNMTIVQANTIEYTTLVWIQIVVSLLMYVSHAVNFYVFFATSSRYRRQVKYCLVKKCWAQLKCWDHRLQNTVHPLDEISIGFRSESA